MRRVRPSPLRHFKAPTGGTEPLRYEFEGLPDGLVSTDSQGTLSGTPTLQGVFRVPLFVRDAIDRFRSKDYVITICASGTLATVDGTTTCPAPDFVTVGFTPAVSDVAFALNVADATFTLPAPTGGTGTTVGRVLVSLQGQRQGETLYRTYPSFDLPAGLTYDADTRIISGTPTETGSVNLRYQGQDQASGSSEQVPFTLRVVDGVAFSAEIRIRDAEHVGYVAGRVLSGDQTVLPDASSVANPITYSVTGLSGEAIGVAVPGLSFDPATRTLSGTPTVAGTTVLTYTATDALGNTAQQDFPLKVAGPQLAGVLAQTYSIGSEITAVTLPEDTATSLTPVTYSLADSSGSTVDVAVPGLTYDATTRILSGTPNTVAGATVLTYTATDTNNNIGVQIFSVTATGPDLPALTNGSWSAGSEITAVTLAEGVQTGTTTVYGASLTYSLTGPDGEALGEVVPGLVFDATTRILTGTPTLTQSTLLTYTATDPYGNTAWGRFLANVTGPSFTGNAQRTFNTYGASGAITATTLYDAKQADGTTAYGTTLTYTLLDDEGRDVSGSVPGLRFNPATRILSGTPTTPGTYRLVYTATDLYGNTTPSVADDGGDTRHYFTLTVTGPQLGAVADQSFSTGSPISSTVGSDTVPYVQLSAATGPVVPVIYSLTGPDSAVLGDAVPGLSFDATTRRISGTPERPGTTLLTYRVEAEADIPNLGGSGDEEIFLFTVTGPTFATATLPSDVVSGGAGIVITATTLPEAFQLDGTTAYGTTLTYTLRDQDGQTVDEAVPGMTFNPTTRILTGTSIVVGTTRLTYTATDGLEQNEAITTFDLQVPAVTLDFPAGDGVDNTVTPPSVSYVTGQPVLLSGVGVIGLTFARPTTGVHRPQTLTVRMLGQVPGLALHPITLALTGTPTAAGTTLLTWEVTDLYGNKATRIFRVIVTGPAFDETEMAALGTDGRSFVVGTAVNDQLPAVATRGSGTLTYAVSTLPPGLSFDQATRTLSGTPTTTGTSLVVYTVRDERGNIASQVFPITVTGLVAGDAPDVANALTVGTAITFTAYPVATMTDNLTITYAVTGTEDSHGNKIPLSEAVPGLTFDGPTRQMSGTPLRPVGMAGDDRVVLLYTATDGYGNTAEDEVKLYVAGGPTLTQADLTLMIGQALTSTTLVAGMSASSSTLPQLVISTYSLTGADSTPLGVAVPGLVFDATTRVLSGTPTTAGTTVLDYTATDASGNSVTPTFSLIVGPALAAGSVALLDFTDTVDGTAIAAVTLPLATGVDSSLDDDDVTYSLTGAGGTPLGEVVPGLVFDATTRVLSGTPTTAGTTALIYAVTVSTATGVSSTDMQIFTVTLEGPTIAAPAAIAAVAAGTAIASATLPEITTSTSFTPLTYAVTGADGTPLGEAVPGLVFDATTRVLSGTPTTAGMTALAYAVTDSNGNVSSPQSFTVTVTGVVLAALSTALASQTFDLDNPVTAVAMPAATDAGTLSVTYAVTGADSTPLGEAVPGLVFAPASRQLSGTPSVAGTTVLTYSATAGANTATQTFTVIVPELAFAAVQDDQDFTLGGAITLTALPTVTGTGSLTAAYSLTGPNGTDLAEVPGLTFTAATRVLSGAPTVAGVTELTYTASNGTSAVMQIFTVTVPEPALADIFDLTFEIGGSTAVSRTLPPMQNIDSTIGVTYALTGLAAVPGLAFDAATRILSGTPTGEAGSFPLTYTATTGTTASITTTYSDTQSFMVAVVGGPTLPPVGDQTYPLGAAITSLTLGAAGNITGFTDVTYTLTDLTEVDGLAFDAATRVLSGTPTVPGVTELTYTVTVGDYTVMRTFTVTVTGATLTTADRSYPVGGTVNTTLGVVAGIDSSLEVTYTLKNSVGADVDATGNVVPGLAFAPATQVLLGTPTATGTTLLTYTAVTTATTDISAQTATVTFTVTVTGATFAAGDVGDQSFPVGVEIAASTELAEADGVPSTAVYALTGPSSEALGTTVPGLTFTAGTRVLSGIPTQAGTDVLTYTVTAGSNTATATFTLTVTGPTLAAVEDRIYTQGAEIYTQGTTAIATPPTLPAAGSVGGGTSTLTPVVYTLTGPNGTDLTEVAGLTFTVATRVLSGAPTAAGTTLLTYTATDSSNNAASRVFAVTVNPPVTFDTPLEDIPLPLSVVSNPLRNSDRTLSLASGGTGALTYALTDAQTAALTDSTEAHLEFLVFDPATRQITGVTVVTGMSMLTYTATDANSAVASATFMVTVASATIIPDLSFAQTYTYTTGAAVRLDTPTGTGGSNRAYFLTGPNEAAVSDVLPGLSFDANFLPPPTSITTHTRPAVTGTPTSAGSAVLTYIITASNDAGTSTTFTVTVIDAPVFPRAQEDLLYPVGEAILLNLPEARSSTRVTYTLAALPAGAPLPAGLIFEPNNRRLRGRPAVPATTELVYTARADDGVDTLTFSITVVGPTPVSTVADMSLTVGTAITAVTLPEAIGVGGGRAYSLRDSTGADVDATDDAVPGLVFDAATRVLSGEPTLVGTTELTYTATGVYGSTATQTFLVAVAGTAFTDTVADQFYPVGVSIPVAERLQLPAVLPSGSGTLTYSLTGPNGTDLTEAPGLTFTVATRVLSGTPTATGTTLLTYGVTGAVTGTVTPLTFRAVVTGGPTFVVDTIPDQVYDLDEEILPTVLSEASGGVGVLTYSLQDAIDQAVDADGNAASRVPDLRFDPATRTLFGTMGAAAALTYTVTDAGGNTASLVFALLREPVSEGFVDAVADQIYSTDGSLMVALTLPEARLDVEDEDASVTYTLVGPSGTGTEVGGLVFDGTTRVLSGMPAPVADVPEKVHLLTYTATDGDSNVVGLLNFRITLVTGPAFVDTDFLTLFPVSYASGQPIIPVEFPEATGYGTLTYGLAPVPHGLIFDRVTRTLSGEPLESNEIYRMQYRACDAAGGCISSTAFLTTIVPMLYFEDDRMEVEDQTYARRALISTALTLPKALPALVGADYEYDIYPMPAGLVLRSNTLLGAPTIGVGTYTLTYTATHPDTLATISLTFDITGASRAGVFGPGGASGLCKGSGDHRPYPAGGRLWRHWDADLQSDGAQRNGSD